MFRGIPWRALRVLGLAAATFVIAGCGEETTPEREPAIPAVPDFSDLTTPRAYTFFQAGETALRQKQWAQAIEQFNVSIGEDPTFAMPYYRGAMATWRSQAGARAYELLKAGKPHAGRLPERWRDLYHGTVAYFEGRDQDAFNILNPHMGTPEETADGLYVLGELLVHSEELRDLDRARQALKRAMELDPSYTAALFHVMGDGVSTEDIPSRERRIARCRLDYSKRDRALLLTLIQGGYRDEALEPAPELIEVDDGQYLWGHTQVAFGQFKDGLFNLVEATKTFIMNHADQVTKGAEFQHQISLVLAFGGDLNGAVAAASEGLALTREYFPIYDQLALVLLQSGRIAEAAEVLKQLDDTATASQSPAGLYQLDLTRARVHLWRGEVDHAQAALDRAAGYPPAHRLPFLESLVQGRIHDARGEWAKAAEAYAKVWDLNGAAGRGDYCDAVMSLYLSAQAMEQSGDRDGARQHYEQFLNHWGNADIPIPEVAEAGKRLRAIEAGL